MQLVIGTLIPMGNRQYCLIDVPFLVKTHEQLKTWKL